MNEAGRTLCEVVEPGGMGADKLAEKTIKILTGSLILGEEPISPPIADKVPQEKSC